MRRAQVCMRSEAGHVVVGNSRVNARSFTRASNAWFRDDASDPRQRQDWTPGGSIVKHCLARAGIQGRVSPPRMRRASPQLRLVARQGRAQHLPIGSGAVEASAKHLVQQRMKRAGSRWSDPGARAILDLRCHLLSGLSLELVA
jgi:hypothetical protein